MCIPNSEFLASIALMSFVVWHQLPYRLIMAYMYVLNIYLVYFNNFVSNLIVLLLFGLWYLGYINNNHIYLVKNTAMPYDQYSRVELGVALYRSPIFFAMKILPPTLVTLLVSSIILFLDPYNVDTRLGSAIFGLLTMVC